jgi:hypothetical protein
VTGTEVAAELLEPLLASPTGEDPEDVFVEETVVRLIDRLGLPRPDLGDPMRAI